MKLTNNVKLLIKNKTMKKNLLYALVACLAFTFAACSDDPLDATSKHVYGPDENPYLKTDLTATISTSLEFPVQRINVPQEIKLADYAETFQAQLGMTVDEVVNGLSSGSVVFCPINVTRGQWLRNAAPTKGTHGWQIRAELDALRKTEPIDKVTFGSADLIDVLRGEGEIESITFVGLCTDICVISNAMLVKAFFPEIPLTVDAKACAGVTPESHARALEAMKICQIKIANY